MLLVDALGIICIICTSGATEVLQSERRSTVVDAAYVACVVLGRWHKRILKSLSSVHAGVGYLKSVDVCSGLTLSNILFRQ